MINRFQVISRHAITRSLFFLVMMSLWGGCAGLIQAPPDQPRARSLVNIYAEANQDLTRFKGLGRVQLVMPEETMSGRLALAGKMPNKMRIEWLTPFGQPLLRMAANGDTIAIESHQTSEIHQLKQTDAALDRIIHIPIGIESLLSVLSGRLPKLDYAAAQVLHESDTQLTVVLKDRWSAALAWVEVDLDRRQIKRFTALAPDGGAQYQIDWIKWQRVQDYLLPRDLEIAVDDHHQLKLTMDRYWCNVQLPDEIFSEVVAIQR